MLNIFTDNCTPTTREGDRVLRIITANPCDEILTVVDGDMGVVAIEEEVRLALRHKFGRNYAGYRGFEDVTELYKVMLDGDEYDLNVVVNLMDDELREELHAEGIDDPQEFVDRYVEAHKAKFGETFEV